jgi:CBS domain-containing protein
MSLVDTVRSVLKTKGGGVWSLPPEATVYDAIAMMAEKGVGALLVISEGRLAGIMSERDYARKVILQGRSSKGTQLREIMSSPVITVRLDNTVDECMRIVTERHIRHLPVMEGETVVGVVSIGDLVRSIISAQAATIDHLHGYIAGRYPG